MLLRRLAKHLRAQDWTAIAIEFAIVVLGVFLGLQVGNWNQERLERQAAVTYRERLLEEIRRNEHNLLARQSYYRAVQARGQAALDALRSRPQELGEQFLVDAYMATQRWLMEIDRGVYDEILSAGVVDTVLDAEARMRVSNYFVVFESILVTITDDVGYRNLVRTYLPVELQRDIEAQSGDRVVTNDAGAVTISWPASAPEWSDAVTLAGVNALLAAPDLARWLNFRLSDVDTKLAVLQRNIDRTRGLAAFCEERWQ